MGAHLVRNEGVAGSSPAGSASSTDQRRACTRHGTSPRRHPPRRRWACTRWRFAGRGGTARSPCAERACSASGSAPRWHRGGSGFDPRQVHGFAGLPAFQQGADRFRPGRLTVRVEPGKVTSPRQHAWHQEAPTASTSPSKGRRVPGRAVLPRADRASQAGLTRRAEPTVGARGDTFRPASQAPHPDPSSARRSGSGNAREDPLRFVLARHAGSTPASSTTGRRRPAIRPALAPRCPDGLDGNHRTVPWLAPEQRRARP